MTTIPGHEADALRCAIEDIQSTLTADDPWFARLQAVLDSVPPDESLAYLVTLANREDKAIETNRARLARQRRKAGMAVHPGRCKGGEWRPSGREVGDVS